MAAKSLTKSQILTDVEPVLRRRLPHDWQLEFQRLPPEGSVRRPDALVAFVSPTGERAVFVAEARREATAASLDAAARQLESSRERPDSAGALLLAAWLGSGTQDALLRRGISYADVTGNVRVTAQRPGLFVSGVGAAKNPWPTDKSLRSLRGRGAMRAARALVDHTPPYGVRELAGRTSTSPATLSRVIGLLEREALVTRDPSGGVASLDWQGVIRRWAADYDVLEANDAVSVLHPRGLRVLTAGLRATSLRYALTGSLAAQPLSPIAPARLGMLYADDPAEAAAELGLRPTDAGANVVLLRPYDDVVFQRTVRRDGLVTVAATQLAVDLLTGPGRSPGEGEELLRWMEGHHEAWRA